MNNILWLKNFSLEKAGYHMLVPALIGTFLGGTRVFFGKIPARIKEIISILKGHEDVGSYMKEDEVIAVRDEGIKLILSNPAHAEANHRVTYRLNDEYFATAKEFLRTDFSMLSDIELCMYYKKMLDIQLKSHANSIVTTWFVDSEGETFAKILLEKTREIVERSSLKLEPTEVFTTLTSPEKNTMPLTEEMESLQLLKEIEHDKEAKNAIIGINDFTTIPENISSSLKEKMIAHYNKWRWLQFTYMGPAYDIDYYLQIWNGLLKQNVDIDEKLRELEQRSMKIRKQKAELEIKLNLTAEEKRLYDFAADIVYLKNYRKECMYFGSYAISFLLKEMAKRLYMSINQIYLVLPSEIVGYFEKRKPIDINEINKREGKTVIYTNKGSLYIYTGEKAEEFLKGKNLRKEEVSANLSELKGTTACSGYAKGIVKIVNNVDQISKMEQGDIMVAHSTFPSLVPAMKKAAAIVTEDGGITCHAAIVSRELKIPCITGIKIATKALKDGDEIEVDATNGIVRLSGKSKKKTWKLFTKDFGSCTQRDYWFTSGINKYPTIEGWYLPNPNFATVGRGNDLEYWADTDAWEKCHLAFREIVEKDIFLVRKLIKKIEKFCLYAVSEAKKLFDNAAELQLKSNKDLWEDCKRLNALTELTFTYGTLLPLLDLGPFKFLEDTLKAIIARKVSKDKVNDYFNILSVPVEDSFGLEEEKDLLRIQAKYMNPGLFNLLNNNQLSENNSELSEDILEAIKQNYTEFYNAVKEHAKKYNWVYFGLSGPAYKVKDFMSIIKFNISLDINPKEKLQRLENERIATIKKRKEVFAQLKFTNYEREVAECVSAVVVAKPKRKDYQSRFNHYVFDGIFKEIAQRLSLSRKEVIEFHPELLKKALIDGIVDKNALNECSKFRVIAQNNGKVEVMYGSDAEKFFEENFEPEAELKDEINELKGTTACPGVAKGKARIVNSVADIRKMNRGDILVAVSTSPPIVSAMRIASAILTDEGGITCHAAIVSRELKIPCVVGLNVITKAVNDGDEVEVDATDATVKITKKAEGSNASVAEDWFLMEEIPNSSVFLLSGTFRRMTQEFVEKNNIHLHMNLLYRDNALYLYFKRKEFVDSGKKLFEKTIGDPSFLWNINLENKATQERMSAYLKKLKEIDVSKLTNDELLNLYEEFALYFEKTVVVGWTDNNIEFEHELLSSYLRGYVSEKAEQAVKAEKAEKAWMSVTDGLSGAEIFSLFSTPDRMTFGTKQELALQKIASEIVKNKKTATLFKESAERIDAELKKINPKIDLMLTKHTNEFCWYFHMYEGPAYNRIDFIKSLKSLMQENNVVELPDFTSQKKQKEMLFKKLGIDDKHRVLLNLASEMVFNKDLRKHALYSGCYFSLKIFEEIAMRFNITLKEARAIMPWEMKDVFANPSRYKNADRNVLQEREQGFLMQFYDGNTTLKIKDDAIKFFDAVRKKNAIDENVKELSGSCAYPGKVEGNVKIVNTPADMHKVKDGDILVAHQTNPDVLPAMKLAAAFVTDIGGITCHAAIVSREMKKPCIVGTKVASKVLKDDDVVEVNAEAGIVKIISRANKEQNPQTKITYIKPFVELTKNDASIAGGKGASLGEMTNAGIPVPEGFVILADAFELFINKNNIKEEIARIVGSVDHTDNEQINKASEDIKKLILSKEIPEELKEGIVNYHVQLGSEFVAVRSSATAEDSSSAAWAGQLETYLNTTAEKLLENVKKCWASLFTPRAIFYRFEQNLANKKISVAVVVQKMIQSEVSGVAFSVHPVTKDRNKIIIEACFGLGEAIVGGEVTPDSYIIDKNKMMIDEIKIAEQTKGLFKGKEGSEQERNVWNNIANTHVQKLCGRLIIELAGIILNIESHYGFPCDIEWAMQNNKLYITQSRPITTLGDEKESNEKKTSSQDNTSDDRFIHANRDADCNWMTIEPIWHGLRDKRVIKEIGRGLPEGFCELVNGDTVNYYPREDDAKEFVKQINEVVTNNLDHFAQLVKRTRATSKAIRDYATKIIKKIGSMNNDQLADVIAMTKKLQADCVAYGVTTVFADMFGDISSKKARIIEKRKSLGLPLEEYANLLSHLEEKTLTEKAYDDIRKSKKSSYDFAKKYFWLDQGYIGRGITAREIDEIRKHQPKEDMAKHKSIKQIEKELNLSPEEKKIFKISRELVLIKSLRTDSRQFLNVVTNKIIDLLSAKLSVKVKYLESLSPDELVCLIKGDESVLDNIEQRSKHAIFTVNADNSYSIMTGEDKIIDFFSKNVKKSKVKHSNEIKGQTAYNGKVRGKAKLVLHVDDMSKIEHGDIMVASTTTPQLLPAMNKATAFVTDLGGITSHAAIVAREMRKPCIVGTKVATSIIVDGMLIEVDANKGVVRILSGE